MPFQPMIVSWNLIKANVYLFKCLTAYRPTIYNFFQLESTATEDLPSESKETNTVSIVDGKLLLKLKTLEVVR